MKSAEEQAVEDVLRENTSAWFQSRHCKIWAKDRRLGLFTPRMNYLQQKIQAVDDKFTELQLPNRTIGLKPRARGSTTFFTAKGYTAMRRSSTSAIFIGGQSDQTVGLWNMMKTFHKNDTLDWGNVGDVNEKGATFSNGSRAKKETAKDIQAGIGDTYSHCHCTEAARWAQYGVTNAAAVLSNLLKAIPVLPGTSIVLESSADMSGNDFHDRFLRATDADDFLNGDKEVEFGSYVRVFAGWHQFDESALRLTPEQKTYIEHSLDADEEWYGEKELIELYGHTGENGVLHLGETVTDFDVWEQLAWRRYSIREECDRDVSVFDRDFPHSPEVAFMKSGKMRFNATGVGLLRKRLAARPAPLHGLLEEAQNRHLAFRNTDANESQFTLFEKPIPGRRYIVAVDPATGASQTTGLDPDFHGIFCLRAGYYDATGKWIRTATAGRVIPCKWEIDMASDATWKLARYYGGVSGCIIAVEVNMDRGFQERLKDKGANLYVREVMNRRENKLTGALGYQTNEKTREKAISTLAGEIREWDTPGRGLDVWCKNAVAQFENFIDKDGRSEAGQGFHDDDIFAIAIGVELIEHATICPPPFNLMGHLDPHGMPRQSAAATPSGYS